MSCNTSAERGPPLDAVLARGHALEALEALGRRDPAEAAAALRRAALAADRAAQILCAENMKAVGEGLDLLGVDDRAAFKRQVIAAASRCRKPA